MIQIHDHFDGSAHCVECGGKCQLPPDDQRVTSLVRYLFEFGFPMNLMMKTTLEELGVDIRRFIERRSAYFPKEPRR